MFYLVVWCCLRSCCLSLLRASTPTISIQISEWSASISNNFSSAVNTNVRLYVLSYGFFVEKNTDLYQILKAD